MIDASYFGGEGGTFNLRIKLVAKPCSLKLILELSQGLFRNL